MVVDKKNNCQEVLKREHKTKKRENFVGADVPVWSLVL